MIASLTAPFPFLSPVARRTRMHLITVLHTAGSRLCLRQGPDSPQRPLSGVRTHCRRAPGPRSHFSVPSNRSIKQARPTTALRFLVSPLNGAPSTSAPPYGRLLEALLVLLVPKLALLWRKGLARFMTSALHFARSSQVSALATARRGAAQPENRGAPRATSEIGCSPQTGAMQS